MAKKKVLLTKEEFEELRQKAEKADEYYDRILRLQADFDNYKKRLDREKAEFVKFANEQIIMDFVRLLDDFERAVEAGRSKHDFDVLYKGVEMIWKDLKDFLAKNGLKEIDAKGRPFNPHEHEAMMQEERDDVPEDHVVEEFQKGYILNGRVIRPARVKIARQAKKNIDAADVKPDSSADNEKEGTAQEENKKKD